MPNRRSEIREVQADQFENLIASKATAGVVNILSYIVLIPRMGLYGAVIASILYYAVNLGMHLIFINVKRREKTLNA